jgi:hypothetical protein
MSPTTAGIRIAGDLSANNLLDIGYYSTDGNYTWSSTMFIANTNVGIGTASPSTKLHISGGDSAIRITPTGSNDPRIDFTDSGGTVRFYTGYDVSSGNFVITSDESGFGSSNIMVMSDAGNVGIGVSSLQSWAKLQVAGIAGAQTGANQALYVTAPSTTAGEGVGIRLSAASGSNEAVGVIGMVNNASGNAGSMTFHTYNGGADIPERMRLDSNGVLQLTESSASGFLNATGTALELDINRNPETGAFGDTNKSHARIQLAGDNGGSNIKFNTASANNTTATERMRVSPSGDILFGCTSLANDFAYFEEASSNRRILNIGSSTTSSIDIVNFRNPNGIVGGINTDGFTTSFSSSSDYRLKENVVEMTDALDRVSELKPSRFNFIGEEKTVDGFLAHEVSDIVPEAISGTKDEVDEKGNPIYQGIDQSKLVPLLVGAIQELKAEIETLKSQINN